MMNDEVRQQILDMLKKPDPSGVMFREKNFMKHEKFYKIIKDYIGLHKLSHLPFNQQLWHFQYDVHDVPLCKNEKCNNFVEFRNRMIGYREFCSNVCHLKSDITKEKRKKTVLEKYGVENVFQNDEIKKQMLKTLEEKHGLTNLSNVSQIKQIQDKIKQTNLTKYNSEYYLGSEARKLNNKQKYFKKINIEFPNNLKFDADSNILTFKCDSCNQNYEITTFMYRKRKIFNHVICTNCNKLDAFSVSNFEKNVVFFIKSIYNGTVIENNRTVINPKELDIYLPDLKIAIECNGIYWHSEMYCDTDYHYNKFKQCYDQGITLIQIWEDDWLFKCDIVKSRLRNKIGTNYKIYARQCSVVEISNKEYRDFCNSNHLMGYATAKHKIALKHDDQIVSLISFSKPRIINNIKNSEELELIRYCNVLNTNVIGGLSKMWKYFIEKYQPLRIICYSNLEWGIGDVYSHIDMKMQELKNHKSYVWLINEQRNHRWKYRKDVLIKNGSLKKAQLVLNTNDDLTEQQIMEAFGYIKINLVGNSKWIWSR